MIADRASGPATIIPTGATRLMEVRCCCDPGRLLGWLPIAGRAQLGAVLVFFPPSRWSDSESGSRWWRDSTFVPPPVRLKVCELMVPRVLSSYLALKAEGVSVDDLRSIDGWKDATEIDLEVR